MSFVLGFVYFIVAKSAVAKTGRSIRLLYVRAGCCADSLRMQVPQTLTMEVVTLGRLSSTEIRPGCQEQCS